LNREYEASGQIKTQFISTHEQLGNLLTKPLCRIKFQECAKIDLFVSSKYRVTSRIRRRTVE
jgi:hypothetical protein